MMLFLLALASTLVSTSAAAAGTLADNVQARLVPGWRMPDGRIVAGLELTLAPGWKTYWRAPGDAGIPPVFDWSGSRNLSDIQVTWPTPVVFSNNGSRSIGYKNRVLLPLTILPRHAGKSVRLKAQVDIGVCKEICVPISLDLSQALGELPTTPRPALVAALADRPFTASEAGLKKITCTLTPAPDGLRIRTEIVLPSTGGRETAVIETDDPLIWASEPHVKRKGSTLVAEAELLHASGGAFALNRSGLRFTVLGTKHAVDIQGCDG